MRATSPSPLVAGVLFALVLAAAVPPAAGVDVLALLGDGTDLRASAATALPQYLEVMQQMSDVLTVIKELHGDNFNALLHAVLSEDQDKAKAALTTLLNGMSGEDRGPLSDTAKKLQAQGAGSLLLVFSAGAQAAVFTYTKDVGIAINLSWLLFPTGEAVGITAAAPLATVFTATGVGAGLEFGTSLSLDFMVGFHISDPSGVGGAGIDLAVQASAPRARGLNLAFGFDATTVTATNLLPDLVAVFAGVTDEGLSLNVELGLSYADVVLQYCGDGTLRADVDGGLSVVSPFPLLNGGGVETTCDEEAGEAFWTAWSAALGVDRVESCNAITRQSVDKVFVLSKRRTTALGHREEAAKCGGFAGSVKDAFEADQIQALVDRHVDSLGGPCKFWTGGHQINTVWKWDSRAFPFTYVDGLRDWSKFNNRATNAIARNAAYLDCCSGTCVWDQHKAGFDSNSWPAIYVLPTNYATRGGGCGLSELVADDAMCVEPRATGKSCASNRDCQSYMCNTNLAEPVCDSRTPGTWMARCDDAGDCPSGTACTSGACRTVDWGSCKYNYGCGSGKCACATFASGSTSTCTGWNGVCFVEPQGTLGPCTDDRGCTSGMCNKNLDPPLCDNRTPGTWMALCDEIGSDCPSGTECTSGRCKTREGHGCKYNYGCATGKCACATFASGSTTTCTSWNGVCV